VANTITSYEQIMSGGYPITEMDILVNCPVVSEGSTANLRLNGESPELTLGWYKNQVVYYFNFSEKALTVDGNGMVPLSPIYVTFNINPDQPGGGPPSGFVVEELTGRTHNVVATLPADEGYSPLWSVNVYNNTDFENVSNLQTALSANILATGVANVNCPTVATYVMVDRFSVAAGNLFIRDETNEFPGPNKPVDFDQEPFITRGLGPDGEFVSYYNFDVMPTEPAPIYVLIRDGESAPVEGQMNIIDVIPGDENYNDFWDVHFVTVPSNYVANTITSYGQIMSGGYPVTEMDILVNCPVVSEGSTADLRLNGESPELTLGWNKNQVVYYFNFSEKALTVTSSDMVPLSPIYVTFNLNPDQPGGGPPSGFRTDETGRAHNVIATLPADEGYSPLWSVNVYNNTDFANVSDLQTALSANILATGVANVNCPVVLIEPSTSVEEYDNSLPAEYALDQNFPNPFNPSTIIAYQLPENGLVTLKIFDVLGKEVTTLVNEYKTSGRYNINFSAEGGSASGGDAVSLASGVYLYQIKVNGYTATRKLLLMK
jgi:hypothetical protein